MCTATWIRSSDSYEVFFNRDELHSRSKAAPPQTESLDGMRYLAPSDPDGGGTWIGVNESGITAALLNYYPASDRDSQLPEPNLARAKISRGRLVREALRHRLVDDAIDGLRGEDLTQYLPFSLLCFASDGRPLLARWFHDLTLDYSPSMPVTSSSYQTSFVVENRIAQFQALRPLATEVQTSEVQSIEARRGLHQRYHQSHSPERSARSVCMHREDAQTQSLVHIVVATEHVTCTYVPGSPCATEPIDPVRLKRD